VTPDELRRCGWAPLNDPVYLEYHDEEWGVPVHDDVRLFEFLVLEGAQAGLSWSTILKKRDAYRAAFAGFDPYRVARFNARSVERLLADASIVRNRSKIEAAIANARATLAVRAEHGSLDRFLWSFVDGRPIRNRWTTLDDIPAETERSRAMSAALRERGFRFVGPTICYAFMQAVGMVNDHIVSCFRWSKLAQPEPSAGRQAD
jgi:DNA-3-methyladenine glycosylase I